jgi:uncharacterized protein (DUF433 family)
MRTMSTKTLVPSDDIRVAGAFLTPQGVSALTGINKGRAYRWAREERVTTVEPRRRGWPSIPLLGLAEYATFTAWNKGGLPIREALAAADFVRREIDRYGFLSTKVMHDGFTAYIQEHEDLSRIIGGQMAFFDVVKEWLQPFTLDADGLIFQYRVNAIPGVVIDPRFNAGRMMFEDSAVPLFAVAGLLRAGESLETVAREYGLGLEQVADVRRKLPWLSEAA